MCTVVSVSCGVAAPNVGVESYPAEVEGRPRGFCIKGPRLALWVLTVLPSSFCALLFPHCLFVFP